MLKWSCKKIFASIVTIVLLGNILPVFPNVYTQTLSSYYERTPSQREKALLSARDLVYEYLRNSNEEPAWKDKYPFVSSEKFFYTANDEIPSYIEFKISTSENYDSGFVIVNLDDNDVKIPIASPVGKAPSEALNYRLKNNEWNQSWNKKLYYFSPFDQWIINEETNNAETLNPHNQEDKILEKQNNYSTRSVDNNFEKILTKEWKQKQNEKFVEMKEKAKNFVESDEFKENILRNWIQDRASWYQKTRIPDTYIQVGYWNICDRSFVPCYSQFEIMKWFFFKDSLSWCGPTALAMVLGYYDRDRFPDVFPDFKAPLDLDNNIKWVVKIMREVMEMNDNWITPTFLPKWAMVFENNKVKIRSKATMTDNLDLIWENIQKEIKNHRPIIIVNYSWDENWKIISWHVPVVFAFSSTTPYVVRMNLGWWRKEQHWFKTTAVDYNLKSSVYYNAKNWTTNWFVTVEVSKK